MTVTKGLNTIDGDEHAVKAAGVYMTDEVHGYLPVGIRSQQSVTANRFVTGTRPGSLFSRSPCHVQHVPPLQTQRT